MSRYEPVVLLTWSMLTAALVFGDFTGPFRTVLAISFLAFAPGLALLRVLGLADWLGRALLALPLSLALEAALSGMLVYAGAPSWDLALTFMLAITIGAVIVEIARPALSFTRSHATVPGKLDDEDRQAQLVTEIMTGGSLNDAAVASGVSRQTLVRALNRSEALRRAVEVASHREIQLDSDADSRR